MPSLLPASLKRRANAQPGYAFSCSLMHWEISPRKKQKKTNSRKKEKQKISCVIRVHRQECSCSRIVVHVAYCPKSHQRTDSMNSLIELITLLARCVGFDSGHRLKRWCPFKLEIEIDIASRAASCRQSRCPGGSW